MRRLRSYGVRSPERSRRRSRSSTAFPRCRCRDRPLDEDDVDPVPCQFPPQGVGHRAERVLAGLVPPGHGRRAVGDRRRDVDDASRSPPTHGRRGQRRQAHGNNDQSVELPSSILAGDVDHPTAFMYPALLTTAQGSTAVTTDWHPASSVMSSTAPSTWTPTSLAALFEDLQLLLRPGGADDPEAETREVRQVASPNPEFVPVTRTDLTISAVYTHGSGAIPGGRGRSAPPTVVRNFPRGRGTQRGGDRSVGLADGRPSPLVPTSEVRSCRPLVRPGPSLLQRRRCAPATTERICWARRRGDRTARR